MAAGDPQQQARAITRDLKNLIERVVIKVSLDCVANLIEVTPVDTGWARANWLPSVGQPIDAPAGARDSVGTATSDQRNGTAAVTKYDLTKGNVFISNNVPYILRLNDGSSTQAAAGFVQGAIAKAVNQDFRA